MNFKQYLYLLIILQLCSCTQRYVFLKKVRVSSESTKTKPFIEKKTPDVVEIPLLETASADTAINLVPTQRFFISTKSVFHKQHHDSTSVTKNQPTTENASTEEWREKTDPRQKKDTEPVEHKHNKYARTAFILSMLAIASVALFGALPFVAVLAIFIFGAMAQDYGSKAYKQLKTSQDKGKWMALVGAILGSLIISAAIAFILAFGLNFSSSASDALFYKEVVIITLGIFTLFMRARFHVPKPKRPKPIEPVKPEIVPGPNNWNHAAIAAFVFASIAILSAVMMALTSIPIFALLSLIGFLGALILGILGLIQIKSSHQKGKTFALIGVLLLPIIFLLLVPVLAILALLIITIRWLIKKHKRKKANKVTS